MDVRVYWIANAGLGRLGIIPRPRGGDWLEDEIRSLRAAGVNLVVSLLEPAELVELDLQAEMEICETSHIDYLSFPIPDRGTPLSDGAARDVVRRLDARLRAGDAIVIHCRQGVGRSALIAAAVLVGGGVSIEEAFERISHARGCPVPDTPEQSEYVSRVWRNATDVRLLQI